MILAVSLPPVRDHWLSNAQLVPTLIGIFQIGGEQLLPLSRMSTLLHIFYVYR
jgi:hypothetical protein